MMAVLHDPRAGLTETQRKAAAAKLERHRRLNGTEAQERADRVSQTAARMDEMVLAIKAEINPAPLVPDETWEERQERLNPLPTEKPEWFAIERELDPDVRRVRIEDIQRAVATRYNVTRSDLLSTRRTANFVRPRQIAMYLARTITLRSLPEIGRRFGGRDHTTALHAVRKLEAIIQTDPAVALEIDSLSNLIKGMA